ncbi:iron complex outermembrane recepter protein [Maricaulis salignorans]|uniref:Iron complex outermembrane recepter protein n=2 Tax=Maricaulis salignorans TaxID=144026 RepID=A0A1G9N774_9PROT|nr:iron complex outermembrane recepter protein [Maricaulis salignorans]
MPAAFNGAGVNWLLIGRSGLHAIPSIPADIPRNASIHVQVQQVDAPMTIARLLTVLALISITLGGVAARADEPVPQPGAAAEAGHHAHRNEGDAHDHEGEHEDDVIVVRATRTGRNVEDDPVRVEVIVREEIEEKAIMRPGNIAMLVNETGGVRVQVTSPALGAANIRMQGLYGRYTQLLADGLPLYGGQAASIGLLQIPPTDLAQVEVIKGSASSLYGASALGGVINLVSRRPAEAPYAEVLFNATTRDGQDITSFASTSLSDQLAASLTLGAHRQSNVDLDDDGWIDMPGYERVTVRPRLHFDGLDGSTAYVTAGFMTEQRTGGTRDGFLTPAGTAFRQNQDTTRFDVGVVTQHPLSASLDLNFRAAGMVQDHEHRFGGLVDSDSHDTLLLEASLAGVRERTDWVLGLAYQADGFRSDSFGDFDYRYEAPGIFAQIDHDFTDTISASLSARADDHSEYGLQTSPRLSVLYRPGDWTIRASWGNGFFAPTPFVEAIEAAGLSRLEPLAGLEAETATTASIDFNYRNGAIEGGLTLFGSDVEGATQLQAFATAPGGPDDAVRLVNANGETEIRGAEVLLRYFWRDFKFTGSYLYLDTSEVDPVGLARRQLPLTPQHSAGFVAMWERHGEGRLGFEAYYTGEQELYDNPYRTRSDDYLHLGLLGEIVLGRVSLFINLENLLDVRQSDEDPILRPARAADGQWTTDIWQSTDGFVVNGGFRLRFGG